MTGKLSVLSMRWLPVAIQLSLLLGSAVCNQAAEDAYAPWTQGRPHDASLALETVARASGSWSQWYDSGVAALEAGEPGRAAACLLASHRLAPHREEPLAALRSLGNTVPPTWCERLGLLGLLGDSWWGLALLGVGATVAGFRLVHRLPTAVGAVGVICLLAAGPGELAGWHDAHQPLVAVVNPTALMSSTGAAVQNLTPGMVVRRHASDPWDGRILVTLASGQLGWLDIADTDASMRTH